MPDFVQTAIKEIDDQLRVLKDEASRLEAARAALTGGTRRRGAQRATGPHRRPRVRRAAGTAAPLPQASVAAVTRAPTRRSSWFARSPGSPSPRSPRR